MLIPLEVHEFYAQRHLAQAAMLVLNLAIVWYLVRRIHIRRETGQHLIGMAVKRGRPSG